MLGRHFFLADNFVKDSSSLTFERSYAQFSPIPVGLEISSHFVSAPISLRVTYATSCPPQYGIREVLQRVETEKTKHARLQRHGPPWYKIQGADALFMDVWQSSARRPCLNLFPTWNDLHFCFEVPSDAWCSEDGHEYNVGALISSWVCVFCWATVCCVEFRWAQGGFVCLSHFTFVVAAAQTFMSLDSMGSSFASCILNVIAGCKIKNSINDSLFHIFYHENHLRQICGHAFETHGNADKIGNTSHSTISRKNHEWVSWTGLFAFLSNLQGRECKKCNWKDAGMAWKAPSSWIGGSIWPRWGTSGYISCRVF